MTTLEGASGQIHFDGASVTITREGDPVAILAGWVYIATAGQESMPSASEVGTNADTVTFKKKQAAAAQALRDEIRSAIGKS